MNIWLICQYYKPEPGAPSARLSGFVKIWKTIGQDVTVLSALPNHPYGKLFDEYKDKPNYFEEEVEGVTVQRHWLYMTTNDGIIKKSLSHISFACSLLYKHFFNKPAILPDVIVVSSPSFFAVISAWLIAWRYKVPFVFEVRDLWPGIFVELGVLKKGFLLNTIEKLELFLYRKAAAVVTVTTGFAKDIASRKIDPKKLFVITNGVADHELDSTQESLANGSVDKLRNELKIDPLSKVMLYIGNHGSSQALGQVVDTARLLIHRTDIIFLMVGGGPDKERLKQISKGLPNIHFVESQPKEKVWAFYNLAYACFVPLKDIPGFSTFIPSKMFEVMAAGTVVIGSVRGEASSILKASKGALIVPPETPEKLAAAVVTLADDPERTANMGAKGMKFVSENYRHSILARNYLGVLDKVVKEYKK